jgi:hypothetical protein
VWQFVDRDGQPTPYLIFVGRSVQIDDRAASPSPVTAPPSRAWLMSLIFFVALAGWFMMRRLTRMSLKPRPLASRQRRERQIGLPVHALRDPRRLCRDSDPGDLHGLVP